MQREYLPHPWSVLTCNMLIFCLEDWKVESLSYTSNKVTRTNSDEGNQPRFQLHSKINLTTHERFRRLQILNLPTLKSRRVRKVISEVGGRGSHFWLGHLTCKTCFPDNLRVYCVVETLYVYRLGRGRPTCTKTTKPINAKIQENIRLVINSKTVCPIYTKICTKTQRDVKISNFETSQWWTGQIICTDLFRPRFYRPSLYM